MPPLPSHSDVVVVGAGHNGLVAATILARAGREVLVLERDEVGGACRTERPFTHAPRLGASTGAYLLGLLPPELHDALGLDLPLLRRDPHSFLPTTRPGHHLLLGADPGANARALERFGRGGDVAAVAAMQEELAALRDDLAPAWLAPPRTVEDTAERFVRPALRQAFVELVRGSASDYLDRFGFEGQLVPAMYALTDAAPGLHGGFDAPGSGFNFLIHNQCRLPGADGTWMVVRGGMGTVTRRLADRARAAGARIVTDAEVTAITTVAGRVDGVAVGDDEVSASSVLVNADPLRLRRLAGDAAVGPEAVAVAEDAAARPGTTLKVNLALAGLPRFSCLPDPVGQHGATIHLLPDLDRPVAALRDAHATAMAGELPERPGVELYLHTAVDPTLRDDEGRHSGALFVQWVPPAPSGGWDRLGDVAADRVLAMVDEVAPGSSALVVDRQVLHPAAIESRFGITGANIFHLDNSRAFTDRLPYRTATDGLYACGAACHPAGSVFGAAGWNAARLVLEEDAPAAGAAGPTAPARVPDAFTPLPGEWHREAELRDGTRVLLRQLRTSDRTRLAEGVSRLSPASRYLRFHSATEQLTDAQLDYLTVIDHVDHEAIVALDLDRRDRPGIGVARYVREPYERTVAEAAITVADEYHGKGAGTLLLGALAGRARTNGVEVFRSYVLQGNHAMLEVFDHLGAERRLETTGLWRVDLRVPEDDDELPSSPAGRAFRSIAREDRGLASLIPPIWSRWRRGPDAGEDRPAVAARLAAETAELRRRLAAWLERR